MWKIYKHTLLIGDHTGWSYIGQTNAENPNSRWKNGTGYRINHGKVFYRAVKKYGWDNFSHEIIEDNILTAEEANAREIYWISFYHTYIKDPKCCGYNMTPGGNQWGNLAFHWYNNGSCEISVPVSDHVPDGFIPGRLAMTEEQKQKLKQHIKTAEHCKHISEAKLGKCVVHKLDVELHIDKAELDKYLAEGYTQGRSEFNIAKQCKQIRCIETGQIFNSLKEATAFAGGHVCDVLQGRRKTAGKCHWEYVDERN